MTASKKIYEVLFKPYSEDIRGYIVRIADLIYLVINSNLTKADAADAQATLTEAYTSAPEGSFILLHGDGRLQKTEYLDFLERAC